MLADEGKSCGGADSVLVSGGSSQTKFKILFCDMDGTFSVLCYLDCSFNTYDFCAYIYPCLTLIVAGVCLGCVNFCPISASERLVS